MFRPQEMTPNDLVFAGTLVDTFKIMMDYMEYVFDI